MAIKNKMSEPAIAYSSLDDGNVFVLINAIKRGINYSFFDRLAHTIPFTLR